MLKKNLIRILLFVGPFFLCLPLSFSKNNLELFFLIPFTFFLIWKYPTRGWIGALAVLLVSSVKYCFVPFSFWQLGLESSMAIAIFINQVAFNENLFFWKSLEDQIATSTEKENLFLKENADLQKTIDCAKYELSVQTKRITSLQNLNSIIRTSEHELSDEKDKLLSALFKKNKSIKKLRVEFEDLQEETAKLKDAAELKRNNQNLLNQLNAARVEKYQTHLINENLARLLVKEARKVKEALDSCEIKAMEQGALKQNLEHSEQELKDICGRLESASKELGDWRTTCEQKDAVIQELKTQIQEKKFENLENPIEVESLKNQMKGLQEKLEEKKQQLKKSQEEVASKHQIEAAHIQLRQQFAEKGELLHQTRSQLFQTETQLESFIREHNEQLLQEDSSFADLVKIIDNLETEIQKLEKDQKELLSLITQLMHSTPESIVKSKMSKSKSLAPELPIF